MTKIFAGTEFFNQPIGNGKTSIFTDMREIFDGTNSHSHPKSKGSER